MRSRHDSITNGLTNTRRAGAEAAGRAQPGCELRVVALVDLPRVDASSRSSRTSRRLIAERRIPFIKVGQLVRFDPAAGLPSIPGARGASPLGQLAEVE